MDNKVQESLDAILALEPPPISDTLDDQSIEQLKRWNEQATQTLRPFRPPSYKTQQQQQQQSTTIDSSKQTWFCWCCCLYNNGKNRKMSDTNGHVNNKTTVLQVQPTTMIVQSPGLLFRRAARQHSAALMAISGIKKALETKVDIDPNQRVLKLLKLDEAAADHARLRLEASRELHKLKLVELNKLRQQVETKLSTETDLYNDLLKQQAAESKRRESIQLKERTKLEGSDTVLKEYDLQMDTSNNSNNTVDSQDSQKRLKQLQEATRLQVRLKKLDRLKQQIDTVQQEIHDYNTHEEQECAGTNRLIAELIDDSELVVSTDSPLRVEAYRTLSQPEQFDPS